jgi:two-component system response regulator YesN
VATNRSRLRERCLLDLVAGTIAPAEFIARAQQLGIDLLAPCYQVMLVRVVPRSGPPDAPLYHVYQQVDGIIADSIGDDPVAFKQGLEETVLILRGGAPDQLRRRAQELSEALGRQIAAGTPCRAAIGAGCATERLGGIPQSFAQALAQLGPGEPPASAAEAPEPEQRHSAALIARARSYIDAHYGDPEISLGHVAAQVLLSPTYFSVVFSREVGETFIEYLTRVRISKAMELLRATSLTASEIGYRVGYQNPRYFSSVFRKATGLPPNEFRRQGEPSDP